MKSQNLDRFLSDEFRRRPDPQLKGLYNVVMRPGIVSLGGGMPVPQVFPFDDVRATSLAPPFSDGISVPIVGSDAKTLETDIFKFPGDVPGSHKGDIELSTALQYSFGGGDARLIDFMAEHVRQVHHPAFSDWGLMMSVGNTFAWDAVLRTFTNPGDSVFIEEFTFPSALENVISHGCVPVPVKMDENGVIPEAFAEQLEAWEGPMPKLLYIIPTGQNPTGSALSSDRRQKVWELAHKYDFLILEDEPYYYLQMPKYQPPEERGITACGRDELLRSLIPSFLDFDTDGRVIRIDSFSKVMAPGIRLGWIVAQDRFIKAITRTVEGSSSKPSGFSQTLVYGLLRRWGHDGFLDWLVGLRNEYTARRDACCDAIFKLLPSGKFQLTPPNAGMFFWLRFDARQHPAYEELGRDAAKVEERFFYEAVENDVLLVPGHWCMVPNSTAAEGEGKHTMYFRGTFASEAMETMLEGVRRFARTMEAHEESSYVFVPTLMHPE